MSRRQRFVDLAIEQLDKPVLWGAKGGESGDAFDCSGLVTWCLRRVGGPDWRHTHSAQRLADELPVLAATPEPGDLAVYGASNDAIAHVVICLRDGRVLSASGAKPSIVNVADARLANARVRIRPSATYRPDLRGFRRFIPLDGPVPEET